MSITNIVRILGLLVAVVAAFITIPYAAVALAILGLIAGYFVKKDDRLLFLILAVAMATVAGSLGALPAIGLYLTNILTNLSALLTAGAVTVILLHLYESMTE
jgi:hypothetical protein